MKAKSLKTNRGDEIAQPKKAVLLAARRRPIRSITAPAEMGVAAFSGALGRSHVYFRSFSMNWIMHDDRNLQ
ncbi:MAG: hypothetical protein PVJ19_07690 [Desulfobacteraceae bacterium]